MCLSTIQSVGVCVCVCLQSSRCVCVCVCQPCSRWRCMCLSTIQSVGVCVSVYNPVGRCVCLSIKQSVACSRVHLSSSEVKFPRSKPVPARNGESCISGAVAVLVVVGAAVAFVVRGPRWLAPLALRSSFILQTMPCEQAHMWIILYVHQHLKRMCSLMNVTRTA